VLVGLMRPNAFFSPLPGVRAAGTSLVALSGLRRADRKRL
jgi:hypothetical protein